MKKILVAATRFEIATAISWLESQTYEVSEQWDVLITGVGSLLASHAITREILLSKPAFMVQAGIAGSFSEALRPGSLAVVQEEVMGDLGVEERGAFHDVFDMQFLDPGEYPFSKGGLRNPDLPDWASEGLPSVKGITVNEITTTALRIDQLKRKYLCQIETMEGAAFHYACLKEKVPFLQLRSVSNFVGERDKNKWQLRHSIEVLNNKLVQLLKSHTL